MSQTSNFAFLQSEWDAIFTIAQKAEQFATTEPSVSAIFCRKALENMLSWLFDHDQNLQLPNKEKINLNDLLWEHSFQHSWGVAYGKDLGFIKKIGNDAAHSTQAIRIDESLACVKYLHRFCFSVARTYSSSVQKFTAYDESLIVQTGKVIDKQEIEKIKQNAQLKTIALERQLIEQKEESQQKEQALEAIRQKLAHYEQLSQQNGKQSIPYALTEAETRKLYIDVMLKEAGWNIENKDVQEYTIEAIDEKTNKKIKLKADYVLWGKDGLPLAVIEAKRSSVAVERGRDQAKNYADALEVQSGFRPMIFYTNGFETYLWDDAQYPPRKVFGFYSIEELQRWQTRKTQKQALRSQKINENIANRYYQTRAIRAVAERFEKAKHRRALLVMATGTGKTRVSAAIVDMLTNAMWAKKILFLADRNALVTQAKKNYNEYLKSQKGIDLTKEPDEGDARIVFSTYQTILNKIDTDFRDGKKRFYGIGHFDLIIIDEAHRSIYDKYGTIFEYFDALYLGLTATPKHETDRDTYQLFGHLQGEPADAYEYTTAVADGFLVPLKKVQISLKFPSQGVRYNDLPEEEKREWERKFYDAETGEILKEVDGNAINQWLFNEDTLDKVLRSLMSYGIKVEGNEKIGKTIIFARSHKHAEFIYERFNILYPQYKGGFAKIIDNYAEDPQKDIDNFSVKSKNPQVAISVDMLDTGIDVPEVLNLVFFKPVYSAAKFWQMLGRGTRLCKALFSNNEDKKEFYVFDVCNVFAFFDENPEGIIPSKSKSLSELTFMAGAELALLLKQQTPPNEEIQFANELLNDLNCQVNDLLKPQKEGETLGFEIRQQLKYVEQYSQAEAWTNLHANAIAELSEHIAPLLANNTKADEAIKRFDLLIVKLQLAILRQDRSQENHIERIQKIASFLVNKSATVPAIEQKKATLLALTHSEFWTTITSASLDKVRIEIRELMKFLQEGEGKNAIYTNFQDELTAPIVAEDFISNYGNYESYYTKIRKLITDNKTTLPSIAYLPISLLQPPNWAN
jgi:type I restriction enzyme, R subunit